MTNVLLSIVTPSYNQSEFISKNIESMVAQASKDIEHIIVDGGSDDGTVEIIQEYEDDYNLRWISEPDRGQTHALNKGVRMAEGEWIGWQNSDDYYLPGAFDNFRSVLDANPRADAIYGDLEIVDENGNRISRKFMTRPSKFIQRHWSLFASNQALFVKKPVIEKIFPLDEDLQYTMDAELTWNLLTGDYKLVHVSEVIGAFRAQPEAKTYEDVRDSQDKELRQIYGTAVYEQMVPDVMLRSFAKAIKAFYLLLDRNLEAILYNLNNRKDTIWQ
jgi:glycosyltransferase involved in cell wall biosynthesis